MSSDLVTVSADLEAYLKSELPTSWKIQDANIPLGATSGIVLTFGLIGFSNRVSGQQLPYSHLAAEFLLELSTPEKDAVKAQAKLLPAIPLLTNALDGATGMTWESAQRGITPAGESLFQIPVNILVSTTSEE